MKTAPDDPEIITVNVTDILDPPILLHPTEDLHSLKELAQSIRVQGQRQPVEVRKVGDKHQIIDGYRRYLAAKHFNLPTLKAIVRDMDDAQAYLACAAANAHRLESEPMAEGNLFAELIDKYGYTIGQICDQFAKGELYVKTRLAITILPERVQRLVEDKKLCLGAAYQVSRFEDPEVQTRLAYNMSERDMTVKEAGLLVDQMIEYWQEEARNPPPEVIDQAAAEPRFWCEYCKTYTTYGNTKTIPMCRGCAKHLEYLFEKERLELTRPPNKTAGGTHHHPPRTTRDYPPTGLTLQKK